MKNPSQIINLAEVVPNDLAGERLDQALTKLFPQYSRARLQDWIRHAQIKVDNKVKRPRDKVYGGEAITLQVILEDKISWQAQAINLDILYEDADLLVVSKPVGLVVHPAAGNPDSTLVNALLHRNPELAKLPRAGIVHRLDKNTSGLLVVAKSLPAHTNLIKQLQAREIEREYIAIVKGVLISGGTVNAAIGRHPIQRKQMAVVLNGKPAVTHYRVLERFRHHSLLKINLETGRTHQIRVHMNHIHHPIVGDVIYGGRLQLPKNASEELIQTLRNFKHQALHAQRLALLHPTTHHQIEWFAPPPADIQNLIAVLRRDAKQ